MKFTCLIVDDEPLARKLMAAHVEKIEGLELVGECGDAIEAANFLRTRKVNLIFLDIQMPEITGLQFIGTLKNPPAVILTTAYRDFAPEAFDLDVVDYLLKPISFERVLKAANKFFGRFGEASGAPADSTVKGEEYLYLKADRKTHKIRLDEIKYIESLDEYVKVHMPGKMLVTRESISSIEQKLPGKSFVRIHRSFIINIGFVTTISAEVIDLGGTELPFGRAYKKSALASLAVRE